jgi:5-methylcytosine-specific restriction endonuclease McrA
MSLGDIKMLIKTYRHSGFQKGHKFGKRFEKGIIPWNKGLKGLNAKEKSPNWKGGKPKCIDCEYQLSSRYAKRCKSCAMKKARKDKKPSRITIINSIKSRIGKKLSIEHKKKISESLKGEKCYLWRGGINNINDTIRKSLEYKLWRIAVFERDNYTCIWCGKRSKKGIKVILNADHIKPFAFFPELRFAIDNGRTLCDECHKKTNTYLNRWTSRFQ